MPSFWAIRCEVSCAQPQSVDAPGMLSTQTIDYLITVFSEAMGPSLEVFELVPPPTSVTARNTTAASVSAAAIAISVDERRIR